MHPLPNINVLAFESGISAPLCTRVLGDLGAHVVKVEQPGRGDVSRQWDTAVNGESSAHVWVNRNKESLELNLKSEQGIEIVHELVEDTDVVVQNFSPGTVERLGLGYETLREINDELVYLNISGYGRDGPYADRKAYDMVMQGETGLILTNGSPDAPAKIPISICDINAAMYSVIASVSALFQRETTGEGQEIDVTMFGGMLSWLGYFPLKYIHNGERPGRLGMRHHLLTPYGPHMTADDQYINFAILSEEHYRAFCKDVIDRPELLDDERFETNEKRVGNRDEFEPLVEAAIEQESRDYWAERLERAGLPWGDVNEIDDVVSHPVTEHLGMIQELDTEDGPLEVVGSPIDFGEASVRCEPMPDLGEDNETVLRRLGYTSDEISTLREHGVIGNGS